MILRVEAQNRVYALEVTTNLIPIGESQKGSPIFFMLIYPLDCNNIIHQDSLPQSRLLTATLSPQGVTI